MLRSRLAAVAVLMVGGLLLGNAAVVRAEDLSQSARDLAAKYAAQLEVLAGWCDEQGLAEQAQQTRQWLRQHDPNKLYIAVLPATIGRTDLPDGTPASVADWYDRFWQLRRQQAVALEALARARYVPIGHPWHSVWFWPPSARTPTRKASGICSAIRNSGRVAYGVRDRETQVGPGVAQQVRLGPQRQRRPLLERHAAGRQEVDCR